MHRLVPGGGRDVCVHSQVRQERFDLRFREEEELARPHAVETDTPDDPLHNSTEERSVCMESWWRRSTFRTSSRHVGG